MKPAIVAAMAGALALSACDKPNSAATISDFDTALALGCPVVASIQAGGKTLSALQRAALATLAIVCPPNPPPTAAGVVLSDIVRAYGVLAPLVVK